jgi:hypothetical protein
MPELYWRTPSRIRDGVRLAAFISVSGRNARTPMNNPLRSDCVGKTRWREAGFDEGCCVSNSHLNLKEKTNGNCQEDGC